MSQIETTFAELEARLDTLIELLNEADEAHWHETMVHALALVRQRNSDGALLVLRAYGDRGDDQQHHSFGTLVLGEQLQQRNPAHHVILNHKLEHLRTSIFVVAGELARASARAH